MYRPRLEVTFVSIRNLTPERLNVYGNVLVSRPFSLRQWPDPVPGKLHSSALGSTWFLLNRFRHNNLRDCKSHITMRFNYGTLLIVLAKKLNISQKKPSTSSI